jgi:alanine racemase
VVGTINYEIVTRFGSPRVPRVYDGTAGIPDAATAPTGADTAKAAVDGEAS